MHSVVSNSATPWTAAHQAPCVPGILQAGILELAAISFPPPGDLHDPGIETASLVFPSLAGEFFKTTITMKKEQITRRKTCASLILG